MSLKSQGKPDLQDLHAWCPEFDQVKEPILNYSQAYLERLSDVRPGTDDIAFFTHADDPGLLPNEEAGILLDFCRTIRTAEDFHTSAPKRLAAILHDSNSAGKSRETHYPLTAARLLEKLSVPRFKSSRRIPGSTDEADATEHETPLAEESLKGTTSELTTIELPEAKRRLVLVVNLDQAVAWALMKTASHNQAAALRSFIADHVSFKASLETTVITQTQLTFELRFHLPFYARRDSSKGGPFHDLKKLKNPQYVDTILSTPVSDTSSPLTEYIYQAEASCLVTGQDHHIWTAHTFIDGCHEYGDGGVLEDYESQKEVWGRVCDMFDPVSGKLIASPSVTPREFFLGLLEVRSELAKNEWHNTRSSYDDCLKRSLAAGAGQDDGVKVGFTKKDYSCWIHSARRVLEMLRRSLIDCISVWETFTSGDIHYFFAPGDDWDMSRTHNHQMAAIRRNFNKMATLLQKLDTVRDELHNTMNELGHHLDYENNESAITQIATAKDVKILTWVTFYSLPFTLVSAFMSARPEVLPLPETIATPFVGFFIIEAVIWILYWFANGRYATKVKNAVFISYHWVRYYIRYKDDTGSDIQAPPLTSTCAFDTARTLGSTDAAIIAEPRLFAPTSTGTGTSRNEILHTAATERTNAAAVSGPSAMVYGTAMSPVAVVLAL
ncbi:hypothetical protein PG991_008766 [Apiospora marii]|uniref:Uncharacterized protein n=1 Tax=Apiospora marii TaxID=335849 RepID=A0ABR1RLQ4_9PEZI